MTEQERFMVKLTLQNWPQTLDHHTKMGFIRKIEEGYGGNRVGNTFTWVLVLEKPQIQQLADEITGLGAFYHFVEEGDGDAHARRLLQKT